MSVYYRIVKILLQVGMPKKIIENDDLLKVINFLHHNYMHKIEVSELASIAQMSESNLYVYFRSQFGTSPIAYLNHYRLTLASDLLKQTESPISEISEQVGFTDPLYFSKLFHKTFQMSPRQYRKESVY
jgi:AraC-like DNA-binding protein